jgi:hypothetical protein
VFIVVVVVVVVVNFVIDSVRKFLDITSYFECYVRCFVSELQFSFKVQQQGRLTSGLTLYSNGYLSQFLFHS